MTPVPKQRRESRHDARQRQLPALAVAAMLAWSAAYGWAEGAAPTGAPEELRAAKLLEAVLFTRQASADALRKMEGIYTDLEARHPRDAAVRNGHAEFLWSSGAQERAMLVWQDALKLEPKNAVILHHLGGGWLAAGEVQKATDFYAQAVASAPQNAGYVFTLANATFLFRHRLLTAVLPDETAVLQRALALFAEASRLEPLNTEYARAYAETFYSLPQPAWPVALVAWQHFAAISPQTDFAQANLARVYLKLGQKDAARASVAKITTPEFQRLKTRLQERIETE